MFKTLIVEDSILFRKLLKQTLHSRFPAMEIYEAGNGTEALQKAAGDRPDLIFMDIKLPGESGLELTASLKTAYPDVPIIILTSYDTLEYREAAVLANAAYFLSKGSTDRESILTLVESILGSSNIKTQH
jgi:DNA-binding NarL/FixJ family response regulator